MSLFIVITWCDGSNESIEVPNAGISQLTTIDVQNREWLPIIAADNIKHFIHLTQVRAIREVSQ
jgi:hypothetical protein